MDFLKKLLQILFGVSLLGLGSFLSVQANIGLAPWDAFSMGLSNVTGLEFSTCVILTSAAIFVVIVLLREAVGVGTILNAFLYGVFIRMWQAILPIAQQQSFLPGLLLLLAGQASIAIGTTLYIAGAMGCGPRDSLMTAVRKRLPKLGPGVIRAAIELAALAAGALMGAKVGFGTVIAAVSVGAFLQLCFGAIHLDTNALRHENLLDTLKRFRPRG